MKHSKLPGTHPDRNALATEIDTAEKCPVKLADHELEGLTLNVCESLNVAGCPLASHVREQHEFEQFLTEISATFVRVPPSEVDSHITSALQRIVEFLGIDRSGFGELTADGFRILQSYELPGVPPSPRVILEQDFPSYATLLGKGVVFRMPEDLPPEANREREYCNQAGLKSNLTIPLKSMGTVVGGLGFTTFGHHRQWSDELVHRLCLIGEIFTNAIGPVWMPVNAMIIRALLQYYLYYGDNFKIECPTGSGKLTNLFEVSEEISRRLTSIFLRNQQGQRPVYGGTEKFQSDAHWRDHLLFFEYFHGDNGAGLGASHQTGWTGLVAKFIELFGLLDAEVALGVGKKSAFRTKAESIGKGQPALEATALVMGGGRRGCI